jgi:hypothetical protein
MERYCGTISAFPQWSRVVIGDAERREEPQLEGYHEEGTEAHSDFLNKLSSQGTMGKVTS